MQRLACYDRLFPRPIQPAATAPAIAPTSPQQRPPPDPQFGMNEAQRRAAAGNTEQSKINDSISATVTDLRTTPSGEFVVILDNGQIWRQIDLESWAPPQKGDRVTIRRGSGPSCWSRRITWRRTCAASDRDSKKSGPSRGRSSQMRARF
jgi:hypothetical protein